MKELWCRLDPDSALQSCPRSDLTPSSRGGVRRVHRGLPHLRILQLETERLTDALNQQEEFKLESVLLVALEDGRAIEAREMVVRRDELIAVRAGGSRGNAARRARARPSPVIVKSGPYIVHGYVHAPPGADPIQHIRSRRAMVPLTGAWIEYKASGEHHRARIGTIIVNRELIECADRTRHEDVRVQLPVEAKIDPRAKDMTGHVRAWHEPDAAPDPEAEPG